MQAETSAPSSTAGGQGETSPTSPQLPAKLEPFGGTYDDARRSYGLASAVLLAWAFIGIGLAPNPLPSVNVTLTSPQAAPYLFVAAVLYFAFRFTIEWYQADASRRATRASIIDYSVAHAIGAGSIGIFVGQKLSHRQVFDYPITFLGAIAVAYASWHAAVWRFHLLGETDRDRSEAYWDLADGLSALAAVGLLILSARFGRGISLVVGVVGAFGQYAIVHWLRHRHHYRDGRVPRKVSLAEFMEPPMTRGHSHRL